MEESHDESDADGSSGNHAPHLDQNMKLEALLNDAPMVYINDKARMLCTICKKSFYDRVALRAHFNAAHSNSKIYRCTVTGCPMWFKSQHERNLHSHDSHKEMHQPSPSKAVKPCEESCGSASPVKLDEFKMEAESGKHDSEDLPGMHRSGEPTVSTSGSEKLKQVVTSRKPPISPFQPSMPMTRRQLLKRKLDEIAKADSRPPIKLKFHLSRLDSGGELDNTLMRPSNPSGKQQTALSTVLSPSQSQPEPETGIESQGEEEEQERRQEPSAAPSSLVHLEVPLGKERRTLAQLINGMLELLTCEDRHGFFLYPMTEAVAAGCTQVLDRLIDLTHIKKRAALGLYPTLKSFRNDLDLLYTNGMRYYPDKSVQYMEAARLLKLVFDSLRVLEVHSGVDDVEPDERDKVDTQKESGPAHCEHPAPMDPVFTRMDKDRLTTLAILNPHNRGIVSETERVRTIGEEVGRLRSGTGLQSLYKEDRRNKVTAINYLDYGPFCSFGPTYDSGTGHCTQADSDLLLAAYGNAGESICAPLGLGEDLQDSEQGMEVLSKIIPEAGLGDDFSLYLLNALTMNLLEEGRHRHLQSDPSSFPSVDHMSHGEDYSVARDPASAVVRSEVPEGQGGHGGSNVDDLLSTVGRGLRDLRDSNYRRLGHPLPHTLIRPTSEELGAAGSVAAGLIELVRAAQPGDVISTYAIRRALGVVGVPLSESAVSDSELGTFGVLDG